jgi:hypothetical protein
VAVEGSSNTAELYYTPGDPVVGPIRVDIPANEYLQIEYTRLGGDVIIVEDSALVRDRARIETGTGKYQKIISDSSQTSAQAGLAEAQAALAAYKELPVTFSFGTLRPGLTPGQLLTIELAGPGHDPANAGHAALLAGAAEASGGTPRTWSVQEVSADLVPAKPWLGGFYGHYRYTVRVIDVAQTADYVDFWEALGGTGDTAAGSAGAQGSTGSAGAADDATVIETPAGVLDGSNRTFALAAAPTPARLRLSLNGVDQLAATDYALGGQTITYAVAPVSDDWHVARY